MMEITDMKYRLRSASPKRLEIYSLVPYIAITLPSHQGIRHLDGQTQKRWSDFRRTIEEHETAHKVILLDAVGRTARNLEASQPFESESMVQAAVGEAWAIEGERAAHEHERFHFKEAESRTARTIPLLEQQAYMRGQLDILRHRLRAIEITHPSLKLPPEEYREYQRDTAEYNLLVGKYNRLADDLLWHQ